MEKEIKGYPHYKVSDLGEIISYRYNKRRVMKLGTDKDGYPKVNLWRNKKMETLIVHRLVADAFLRPPAPGQEINHINGAKTDNRVENLEWCTREENMQHARHVLGWPGGQKPMGYWE